jgi:uncharacterized protein (TIGR00251 family)
VLTADTDATLLSVRVRPRAPSSKIAGARGDRLLVDVTAPPVDGRANEAVCRLLAKTLGVAPGRVRVVSGERGRDKLVRIEGIGIEQASERLGTVA